MIPNQHGRYCDSCKQNVVDFTKMTVQEVKNYTEIKGEVCGSFTTTQLEPELIEAERFISPFKKFLVVILSFITYETTAINITSSNNKVKNQTIISPDNNGNKIVSNLTFEPTINRINLEQEHIQTDLSVTKKRRRLYLSKKFPFIHYRKRIIRTGRFRHDESYSG